MTVEQSNQLAIQILNSNRYRYLYGGKDQEYTVALTKKLASMYPNVFTPSLKALALQDAGKGYLAIDCSGFVCKVLGISNKGSSQLRQSAIKRLPVTKENARPGMALWRSGHIAYVGEDLKIYEAAGTKADLTCRSWESRASAFKELLIIKGSALAESGNMIVENVKNPYTKPTVNVCLTATAKRAKLKSYTSRGNMVKWVQFELNEAGCVGKDGKPLTIDGKFGSNSDFALRAFQSSCKITVDGICGSTTRKYLETR